MYRRGAKLGYGGNYIPRKSTVAIREIDRVGPYEVADFCGIDLMQRRERLIREAKYHKVVASGTNPRALPPPVLSKKCLQPSCLVYFVILPSGEGILCFDNLCKPSHDKSARL